MAEIVPSVKIVERRDISGILEFVNDNKDKIGNNGLLLQNRRPKRAEGENELQNLGF